ncbi:MAG: formate/nitrite transporter family protein [Candidatus Nomurabacteria bacterium]|jgi:formate/nitrite transporter|nr:formate/nitrite transporter family protein [Candidatus Nomurabacteria bacterium]
MSPQELTEANMDGAVAKVGGSTWRLLLLGVAAGLFIGIGAVASSTAAHAMGDAGLARLVSGLVFPIGLCMVVLLGAELFTGNSLMVTAALSGKITWRGLLRNWTLVFVGNFIGAVSLAALMAYFGQLSIGGGALAVYTTKVAVAKASLPWANAFVLGIFCNILVCAAVYMGLSAKDIAGKVLALFLPIIAFVTAGFEHCVANMYYIPAGIFANLNSVYSELIAGAGIGTAALNWGAFLWNNLLPVTLGNIVGGAIMGLIMYYGHVYGKRSTKRRKQ